MDKIKKREDIKILSVGAAVQDVYLQGAIFEPKKEHKEMVEEFILGSKNDLEAVNYSTGGGATNGAVTFARQGLHSMYMGKIGHDVAGKAILDDLHKDGVDTSLVGYSKTVGSGYSCILLAPSGERTIMSYRGASSHYEIHLEDFHNSHPDWIYLTSLEGNFEVIDTIFEYAKANNIKIAMNPGKKELEAKDHLKKLIPQLTLLSMNKEEMQQIYPGKTLEELVRQASKDVHYVIVTDGPKGAMATDRWHIVGAGMYEDVPVIDRTGAGDAFSSGFTAMIASGESLEDAVIFASANSTNVVASIGAKAGILNREAVVHKMPLDVKEL
ncbi:carbohydrate kinase family protein [Candidatus Saccharibacteria bacterium]|jgi:ribokinase|nr:carbohydrate kinase family protein [Candidatus Saccharibacteria bacterium]MBP7834892.1 carbohydrate kinase family protein [Candidatus Saccharibacteria bacterium]